MVGKMTQDVTCRGGAKVLWHRPCLVGFHFYMCLSSFSKLVTVGSLGGRVWGTSILYMNMVLYWLHFTAS